MDEYIKIRFKLSGKDGPDAESVWAKDLGATREGVWLAEINNIPFFAKASLWDTVSYTLGRDGTRNFGRIVKRATRKAYIEYDDDEGVVGAFVNIAKHFGGYGIQVEGAVPGLAAIAYPVDMKRATLRKAMDEAACLGIRTPGGEA